MAQTMKHRRSGGRAVLTAPVAAVYPTSGRTRTLAHVAGWILPAYAVVFGLLPLLDVASPVTDPAGWVGRAGPTWVDLAGGAGAALLGLVALVALAALLIAEGSRRLAPGALLAGLAAAALLLPWMGAALLTAPPLGEVAPVRDLVAAAWFDRAYSGTLPQAGVILLSVSWLALGLAVWCSRRLNRADGAMIMIAAPVLGVLGPRSGMFVTISALLLLAAGIGIAWTSSGPERSRG